MNRIRVSVIEALPDSVRMVELQLDADSRVADALTHPEVLEVFPDAPERAFGIYAKRVDPSTALHDGDRIELYRPLIADPKQSRMERVRIARESGRKR
jgi:putative ubiquitin-RnfH superfamily antitoxin RatB of RatAB toxin-antitoxin module